MTKIEWLWETLIWMWMFIWRVWTAALLALLALRTLRVV